MNLTVILFSIIIIFSAILSLRSTSWLLFWVGIEIGLLRLLPIVYSHGSLLVRESSIKYFLVQSLARILIFFGGALIFILLINSWLSQRLIFIRLAIKIGLFPIHFWVIPVLRGLWYPQIGVILIPLKVAPLALINYIELNRLLINILYFIVVISILGGGFIGNNSSNVRGIVGASSIAHTGWLIIRIYVGKLWFYYLIYSFVLILVLGSIRINNNLFGGISVLSLSGLPPFIIFSVKYLVVWILVMEGFSILRLLIVVLSAAISLIFYLKFSYSFILNKKKGGFFSSLIFILLNFIGRLVLLLYI